MVSMHKSMENMRALYHLTTGFSYRLHPCSTPLSPQPRLMTHWSYIKPELLITPAVYCLACKARLFRKEEYMPK